MENIYNNISQDKKIFLKKLEQYIENKLYFFGSIQRLDYFEDKSDIDVCIFT